ncbi:MAG: arsenate reductase ArsC [Candidatus Burarchaeum sp.]|nr:arsenate reductase ArsC [Candidatus Burarchaeum sp.]MDO8340004.1 arsenate reductase ArsC [Candidatus Burarchaeum sp.]
MKHVLFVCTGNSCRSQIAEAFLNALARGKAEAQSAGSKPAAEIDEGARQVMREVGIELPNTKPKLLTKELIDWADTILTMGCEDACPLTGKPMTDWGIKNPVGKPVEEYQRVRDEIKKNVLELLSA